MKRHPQKHHRQNLRPVLYHQRARKRKGLGLSTGCGIIKNQSVFINVYSQKGQGTRFRLYLPASFKEKASKASISSIAELPSGNGELVIVVDDEETLLELVRNTLGSFGYRVITAGNSRESLIKNRDAQEPIAAILTDASMPEMGRPSMIAAIRSIDNSVEIIFAGGLTQSPAQQAPMQRCKNLNNREIPHNARQGVAQADMIHTKRDDGAKIFLGDIVSFLDS